MDIDYSAVQVDMEKEDIPKDVNNTKSLKAIFYDNIVMKNVISYLEIQDVRNLSWCDKNMNTICNQVTDWEEKANNLFFPIHDENYNNNNNGNAFVAQYKRYLEEQNKSIAFYEATNEYEPIFKRCRFITHLYLCIILLTVAISLICLFIHIIIAAIWLSNLYRKDTDLNISFLVAHFATILLLFLFNIEIANNKNTNFDQFYYHLRCSLYIPELCRRCPLMYYLLGILFVMYIIGWGFWYFAATGYIWYSTSQAMICWLCFGAIWIILYAMGVVQSEMDKVKSRAGKKRANACKSALGPFIVVLFPLYFISPIHMFISFCYKYINLWYYIAFLVDILSCISAFDDLSCSEITVLIVVSLPLPIWAILYAKNFSDHQFLLEYIMIPIYLLFLGLVLIIGIIMYYLYKNYRSTTDKKSLTHYTCVIKSGVTEEEVIYYFKKQLGMHHSESAGDYSTSTNFLFQRAVEEAMEHHGEFIINKITFIENDSFDGHGNHGDNNNDDDDMTSTESSSIDDDDDDTFTPTESSSTDIDDVERNANGDNPMHTNATNPQAQQNDFSMFMDLQNVLLQQVLLQSFHEQQQTATAPNQDVIIEEIIDSDSTSISTVPSINDVD